MIGEEISFFPSKLFINPDIACRVYNVYSGIPKEKNVYPSSSRWTIHILIPFRPPTHPPIHPPTNLCFLFHKGGMWPRICIKHRTETQKVNDPEKFSFPAVSLFLEWGQRNKGSISAQPSFNIYLFPENSRRTEKDLSSHLKVIMFSFSFQSLPDVFQFEKFRIFSHSLIHSLKVMLWYYLVLLKTRRN